MYESKDNIADVIKHKRRFAVFPIVCADHCAYLLKMNFVEVAGDGEKLAQVLEYGYRLYQYDMVLVFCDAYIEAQAMGCPVEFNPYPRLLDSAPPHPSLPLGWGGKKEGGIDRTGEIIKAARILKDKVDVPVYVSIKGPFTLAAFIYGIEDFLKLVLADEKKAKNVLDQALDFQMGYLKRLLSLEAQVFIGDPLASASVISPVLFEKFACKPLEVLIGEVKRKGLNIGIHICGETKPIMPALDKLGADILSIEDITPKTKTLKMGGVSTTTILNENKDMIGAEVKQALKEEYLILATACDVPIETKPENIKAMLKFSNE